MSKPLEGVTIKDGEKYVPATKENVARVLRRQLLPIIDGLPVAIVQKMRYLESECREHDAAVEAVKKDLAEAKADAEAAHQALQTYCRALSDPDYMPLFKATVDPETGEITPVDPPPAE